MWSTMVPGISIRFLRTECFKFVQNIITGKVNSWRNTKEDTGAAKARLRKDQLGGDPGDHRPKLIPGEALF